ncbi:MAG: cwlD [Clostridia bacterium]|nr:cwlD [Clostridia bacterium]
MFNIYKKRIVYVLMTLSICLVYVSVGNLKDEKKERIIDVNSTPITNKIIILDAGHGLPDEGAVGFYATSEQAINLSVTLKLQKLIEQSGAKVLLTRSDENGIYSTDSNSIRNKKVSDIKNRVKLGNESSADIFVSLHLNKFPPSGAYRGWQTFYQGRNIKSKCLSECIQNNINKNIDYNNDNRIPHQISGVYIMDKVEIPTVIVECGFLSNQEETALLKTEEYQNKLAWGIFVGIQNYFEQEGKIINE